MKIRVILAILSSFFCYQAGACNDDPLSIEIIESGLYHVQKVSSIPYQGLPSNSLTYSAQMLHIKETDTIPARLGNALGYRYIVSGGQAGDLIELTIVMKYPAPGITDPGTGVTHLTDKYAIPATIGETGTTFYSFDREWELLSGEWTREIWHGCQKLASLTFQVTK